MFRQFFIIGLSFLMGLTASVSIGHAQEGSQTKSPETGPAAANPQEDQKTEEDAPMDAATLRAKSSFIIGFNATDQLLDSLKSQNVDFDPDKLREGVLLALQGGDIGMTDEEIQKVMIAFQKKIQEDAIKKMIALAKSNKEEGEAFMKEFATQEGVKKLENGVLYQVIKEGSGDSPTPEDVVTINYHGTLVDGTVFDSSVKPPSGRPPAPVDFPVGRVVKGFSSALQAMKPGAKWKVVIPGDLAYGIQGPPGIGPNKTLIFEIELLDVKKKK